jgi:hypothetical protein
MAAGSGAPSVGVLTRGTSVRVQAHRFSTRGSLARAAKGALRDHTGILPDGPLRDLVMSHQNRMKVSYLAGIYTATRSRLGPVQLRHSNPAIECGLFRLEWCELSYLDWPKGVVRLRQSVKKSA